MLYLEKRKELQTEIKNLQTQLEEVDNVIVEAVKDRIPALGSVTLEFEGEKITITIPKVVKWDQLMLKQVAAKIQASGDDPEMYIKYELKVSETNYKAWPEQMQSVFKPARTVTPGKVRVETK